MPRRVTLPTADDLFRPTVVPDPVEDGTPTDDQSAARDSERAAPEPRPKGTASGRVKHDEKMTVYVTSAELLAIEQARLRLRSEHGLAIDRGRLVREALGLVLGDFEERGEASDLVARLIAAQE